MHRIQFTGESEARRYICETSSIYFACILKNEADGIIWGNKKKDPEFLMVWSPYQEGFQLMGQPLKQEEWTEFRSWFDNTIIPFLLEKQMPGFEYGTDSNELAEMFKEIFKDIEILSDSQKIFHWTETELNLPKPSDCIIQKIDSDFLQGNYANMEYITEELINAYGDLDNYYKYGVAYIATHQNTLVARADMLFSDNGYGNISVNTEEEFRKKGISSYLVMKTIQETCRQGLIPIWDCTDDNLPSEKTALKCGFHMIRKDIISWFMLDSYIKK